MTKLRDLLVGVGLVVTLTACAASDDSDDEAASAGPPVPDRPFETFDGEQTSLPEFAGEPMVVNFWASWCPPCIAEMPEFEEVHQDRRDEVRFVGLNTQDDLARAEELVEQTGVTYDLGLDPEGELFRDFEVVSMPSTYLVNEAGAVVERHAGVLDAEQLHELIDEHLTGDGD